MRASFDLIKPDERQTEERTHSTHPRTSTRASNKKRMESSVAYMYSNSVPVWLSKHGARTLPAVQPRPKKRSAQEETNYALHEIIRRIMQICANIAC